jgi:hypothetical protein
VIIKRIKQITHQLSAILAKERTLSNFSSGSEQELSILVGSQKKFLKS